MKYEWRDDQLWDLERGCWVIWKTVSGAVGMCEEMKEKIAHLLNIDADPGWGAGDEYVASLREQWSEINELVANGVGRTPEEPLTHDVRRLVEDYGRTRVNWARADVYLRDLAESEVPEWVRDSALKALGLRPPDTSGGEEDE